MARDSKLTRKDMTTVREADQALDQKEKRRGVVRDYSMNHRVEIRWDLNDDAIRDTMFELRVDDKVMILDAEEVMRLLRWV